MEDYRQIKNGWLMKYFCGYSEYLTKKELGVLMEKMGNISTYKETIFDEDESTISDDHYLFTAAFLFIFSKKYYVDIMPEVFAELSNKQQSTFRGHLEALREEALKNGFLSTFDSIIEKIDSNNDWKSTIHKIFLFCVFIYIWNYFNSLLISGLIFLLFFDHYRMELKLNNSITKDQNDLIIRQFYSNKINENIAWAKAQLIEAKWLDEKGKIKS